MRKGLVSALYTCAHGINSCGFSVVLLGMADYTVFDDSHRTSSFLVPNRINLEEDLFWFTLLVCHVGEGVVEFITVVT